MSNFVFEFDRTFQIEVEPGVQFFIGELKDYIIFLHHGAGYTAQTWLQLISLLKESLPYVCFVTYDMRGHGQSTRSCSDYSFKSLVTDSLKILEMMVIHRTTVTEIFLVGHSLGASVLAALPTDKCSNLNIKYSGLVMIDIIEETAIQALNRMPGVINEIPKSFKDLKTALKWTISSTHSHHNYQTASKRISAIEVSLLSQLTFDPITSSYKWITNLSSMSPFWDSWFVGLTDNFLKFPGSRLLILATDTEYMDREMIIAQMQGKFQLAVIRESGHAIQEDQPEELCGHISVLIQKHLKLSELLKK